MTNDSMMNKQCPICSFPTYYYDILGDGSLNRKISCYKCGEFIITDDVELYLKNHPLNIDESTNVSGWLLSNQKITIYEPDIRKLRKLSSIFLNEKAEILFTELAKKYTTPGEKIPDILQFVSKILNFKNREEFPDISGLNQKVVINYLYLYAKARCRNIQELNYILNIFIADHKKYIAKEGENYFITPEGWSYFKEIQNPNQSSDIAFVAMKFEDKLKNFSDTWFEPAIINAGYKPIRIDKYEHNNLIDDEIIANIRKAKFIIADFTSNSYGVYFESGFAMGFKVPVIHLCNKEYFESKDNKVHFDKNHYSFLLWEWEKGEDIKSRLQLRIEATIGKGNYNV
jgi:hypothetical protein